MKRDGRVIHAPVVVSAAGIYNTVSRTCPVCYFCGAPAKLVVGLWMLRFPAYWLFTAGFSEMR
jgi:hypothetical protein